jgi:hypothetical protein
VSLEERIEKLEPRERTLLGILVGIVVVFVVLLLPIMLGMMLAGQRAHNRELRHAIDAIHEGRPTLARREAVKAEVLARYQKKAPALAGFLEKEAKKQDLEIPESQPRSPVPHGKEFEERSERFTLRKVDLLSLVKFMEGISQSGYPVTISELNLRKRSADSYDVSIVVSAFDRQVTEKPEPDVGESGEEGESEEPPDEEEEP